VPTERCRFLDGTTSTARITADFHGSRLDPPWHGRCSTQPPVNRTTPPPSAAIDIEALLRALAASESDDLRVVERVRRRLFDDTDAAVVTASAGQVSEQPAQGSSGTTGAHQAPPVPASSRSSSTETPEIP
jgi:hypothetical protein